MSIADKLTTKNKQNESIRNFKSKNGNAASKR